MLQCLRLELQQVKEERELEKEKADAIYVENVSFQKNSEKLTEKLYRVQQEVDIVLLAGIFGCFHKCCSQLNCW